MHPLAMKVGSPILGLTNYGVHFGEKERQSTGFQLENKLGTIPVLVGYAYTEPLDSWQRSESKSAYNSQARGFS